MELQLSNVTSGMILQKDIYGKSGKIIFEKNTELTDEHIEFMEKFLIKTVTVSPLFKDEHIDEMDQQTKQITLTEMKRSSFIRLFEKSVISFKMAYYSWKRENPIQMSEVNEIGLKLFNESIDQDFKVIISLIDNCPEDEIFFYRTIASSVLSVYLANRLGFEKKEWTQIGYSALLKDCGKAKLNMESANEKELSEHQLAIFQLHPAYSYKLVEHMTTLTQVAKISILQHHEYLDGTGYPGKMTMAKIHPYARVIAVCDYFYKLIRTTNIEVIINILETKKDEKYSSLVVNQLINELKQTERLMI